jgi:hypothetical protein
MEKLIGSCARLHRNRRLVNTQDDVSRLEEWACEREKRSTRPPALEWRTSSTSLCWDQNQLQQQSSSSRSLGSDYLGEEDEEQPRRYQAEMGINKLCVESTVDVSDCDDGGVVSGIVMRAVLQPAPRLNLNMCFCI